MFQFGSCVRCESPVPDGSGPLCAACLSDPPRADGTATVTDAGRAFTATAQPAAPHRRPRAAPAGYTLVRHLGGGGMGEVWLARDLADRQVALKFLSRQGDPASLARFAAEVKALGRLSDPGIVRLHNVELLAADPYFTMEYAPGGTVEGLLSHAGRVPAGEAARIVAAAARAVAVAHRGKVVHRDIKPSNLLLGAKGEVKVSDFGLAKRLDAGDGATQTGVIVGTYSYMAPEQAAGRGKDATPAADVYALGATLYALLTGSPPFRATTLAETLSQIAHAPPPPMRAGRKRVCPRLEAVCRLCLQKAPGDRYESAAALADDLDAWAANWPMHAKPPGRTRRALYAAKTRRKPLAATGMVMALGLGVWSTPWAPEPGKVDVAPSTSDVRPGWLYPAGGLSLVGPNGVIANHKWLVKPDKLNLVADPVGPPGQELCRFGPAPVGLLELARPASGPGGYRMTADIQSGARVETGGPSEVGLCVGLVTEPCGLTGLPTYRFVRLAFWDRPTDGVRNNPDAIAVRCGPAAVICRPDGPGKPVPSVWPSSQVTATYPIAAAQPDAGPFHRLVIDVTPTGVRAAWASNPTAAPSWTTTLTADRIEAGFGDALRACATQVRDAANDTSQRGAFPNVASCKWRPDGPIAIYARGAGCRVESVQIEPLN